MRFWLFSLPAISFTGCMVGPNYRQPNTPMPTVFSEQNSSETFTPSDEDLVHWWKIFNDPFLDQSLEETNQDNLISMPPSKRAVQASRQYYIQLAALWPEVDLTGFATRSRFSAEQ